MSPQDRHLIVSPVFLQVTLLPVEEFLCNPSGGSKGLIDDLKLDLPDLFIQLR